MQGKVVAVLGATGVVGSGVVRRFLDAGATVVGTSRSADKLAELEKTIGLKAGEPFHGVVGEFGSEAEVQATRAAVEAAVAGAPLDHVVSNLGFIRTAGPATATPTEELRTALDEGLFTAVRAANAFLPGLKAREGSSYTLVSGGLAHFPPPMPGLWLATLKNAAVNGYSHGLASETAKDAVRVNTVCIHFGVAPVGGSQNQLGMPAERDTLSLGGAFVGLARGATKGQVVCLADWAAVDTLAAS